MTSQKTTAHPPAHRTAGTAAAAQATETTSRTVLLLAPLMLGALAYGVLGSVVVPALPLFEHALRTSETGATWILTTYFLAAAGATAVLGRLGDLFGKRRILLITLAVLSAGTLISALSNSLAPELVGRALQGAAGGLFPLAFGIVRDILPRERVRHGIAAITAMINLGSVGVILPGLIVPQLNWHWLFWIPLIFSVAALIGTWLLTAESPQRSSGWLNWRSAVLMVLGITAAITGVSQGDLWGWTSARTLGLLIGGLALCGLWVVAELHSRQPLIDMRLLAVRGVWTTNLIAFMIGGGMYALYALYPIFAQLPKSTGYAYGATLWQTGLYLLPLAVAAGLASTFAGHVEKLLGAVPALISACLMAACGFGYLALFNSHPYDMIISLAVAGVGLGLGLPTLFTNVVHAVPAEHVGQTSGMNTVVRMIGGAIGTQVVSILITGSVRHGVPRLDGFIRSLVVEVTFMAVAAGSTIFLANRRHGDTV